MEYYLHIKYVLSLEADAVGLSEHQLGLCSMIYSSQSFLISKEKNQRKTWKDKIYLLSASLVVGTKLYAKYLA